jgi:precorrin-4/cobalt-precorrin-4 C11-methyltransferase
MISFVGAGPGAPDLLTLRGADRLAQADIVVWASSLVPEEVLVHAAAGAAIHDSAGMTLEDVLAVYESVGDEARVVRLHSGDVAVYSAVQEQVDWCVAAGRSWEIVPGVGSLAAASALLGRELTAPGVAQSVVSTRLPGRTAASMPPGESVAPFARHRTTMAVYLSAARPRQLVEELLDEGRGYPPDTPAALVVRASWPDERVVLTTVGELADAMASDGARTTALVLVGPALSGPEPSGTVPRCHLYDPGYAHGYRRRSLPGTTTGRPTGASPTTPSDQEPNR